MPPSPNDELSRRTERYATLMERRAKEAFLRGITKTKQHSQFSVALEDIATGKTPYLQGKVLEALLDVSVATDELAVVARDAFVGGGKVASKLFSGKEVSKALANIDYSFDPTLYDAILQARVNAARMVKGINQTTRDAISQMIQDAFADGIAPYELAERLQYAIGLTAQHAQAVGTYRNGLITSGSNRNTANRLARDYAQRLLLYRANNIARTEMLQAANLGQQEYWRQAQASGQLSGNLVQVWIATLPSDRTCPTCRPMHGQTTPIGQAFSTPFGPVDVPPLHPQCRCTVGIDYEAAKNPIIPIGKGNPHHDQLGRFSSGGAQVHAGVTKTQRKGFLKELDDQGYPSDGPLRHIFQTPMGNGLAVVHDKGKLVGGVQFDHSKAGKSVTVTDMRMTEERKGHGTAALREVAKHAQRHDHELGVTFALQQAKPFYARLGAEMSERNSVGRWTSEARDALAAGKPIRGSISKVAFDYAVVIDKANPYHRGAGAGGGQFTFGPGGGLVSTTQKAGGYTQLGLTLLGMGKVGEYLLDQNQAKSGTSRKFGKIVQTEKTAQGNNPIDLSSKKYAIELKTITATTKQLKVGIKAEEVDRKTKAAKQQGKTPVVACQIIDPGTGMVHVFAYTGGFKQQGAKSGTFELTGLRQGKKVPMEHIGSYKVTGRQLADALKATGQKALEGGPFHRMMGSSASKDLLAKPKAIKRKTGAARKRRASAKPVKRAPARKAPVKARKRVLRGGGRRIAKDYIISKEQDAEGKELEPGDLVMEFNQLPDGTWEAFISIQE